MHQLATPIAPLDHCTACGTALVGSYFVVENRPEHFCAECMHNRPRCAGCGVPVGALHWSLHDGRVLCARCHQMAVYDPTEAFQLYEATVRDVVAQLGLALRVGVAFRLVDAIAMTRLRTEGGMPPTGEVLGLYQRHGTLRVIYMLYGLPKLTFRTTVAHEYAHAWQGENCPLLDDEVLREGFAEWVAYHHLQCLGCSRAAEAMLTSNHPYRPMFQRVLAIEQCHGTAGVIEHLLAAGRGERRS